jgi:SAM-dependent methyltransferase
VPDIDDILETWDSDTGWTAEGDEWSGAWGGTEPLWWGTLLPRIHAWVPSGVVLELGPGHGRWSQFLRHLADELILVDVAPRCIDSCRSRFSDATNMGYHVGDGKSLPMVADGTVDFAFSFDSLVHAEADVMEAYANELARVLKPDGVAFLHHSNMGAYARSASIARRLPRPLRLRLTVRGLVVNVFAWRAESATAAQFNRACDHAGLACVSQELIAWEFGRQLTDVISVVTPRGSCWERPTVRSENPRFMDEARGLARMAPLYAESAWDTRRSKST